MAKGYLPTPRQLVCPQCGVEFTAVHARRKHCSEQCAVAHHRASYKERQNDRRRKRRANRAYRDDELSAQRKYYNELVSTPEGAAEMAAKQREAQLARKFNLSVTAFEDLLAGQQNRCAICSIDATEYKARTRKNLAVDHEHGTTFIRGLLCSECNNGIGKLGDSLASVMRAAQYLVSYETRRDLAWADGLSAGLLF